MGTNSCIKTTEAWAIDIVKSSPTLQDITVANHSGFSFKTNLSLLSAMFPLLRKALAEDSDGYAVIISDAEEATMSCLDAFIHTGAVEFDMELVDAERESEDVKEVLCRIGLPVGHLMLDEAVDEAIKEEFHEEVKVKEEVKEETKEEVDSDADYDPQPWLRNRPKRKRKKKEKTDSEQISKYSKRKPLPESVLKSRVTTGSRKIEKTNLIPIAEAMHLNIPRGICPKCSKSVRQLDVLEHERAHELGLAPDVMFVCLTCDETFKTACGLRNHKKEHLQDKWSCNECDKQYPVNYVNFIAKHKASHSKVFLCDDCGAEYRSIGDLNLHIRRAHDFNETTCTICGEVRKNQWSMNLHVRRNHKYQLPCQYCGKQFSNNTKLKKHIAVQHTENSKKPFICQYCGKGFGVKGHFTDHIAIHENRRVHCCKFCDYRCNSKPNVRKHMRQVHKETDVF